MLKEEEGDDAKFISNKEFFKLVTELVNRMPNHNIEVNPSVFIYDKSKLPDCDCTL